MMYHVIKKKWIIIVILYKIILRGDIGTLHIRCE